MAGQGRLILSTAFLTGLVVPIPVMQLPIQAVPPPWAPAHGYRAKQYSYIYYPQRQIYYSPTSRIWFWLRGGGWQVGASLPSAYQSFLTGGIPLVLDTDRPYLQHAIDFTPDTGEDY